MGCQVQARLYSYFVVFVPVENSLSAIITVWADEARRHQILVTYSKENLPSLKKKGSQNQTLFTIEGEICAVSHPDCCITMTQGNDSDRIEQL
jgi:hypothetical protein